LRYTWLLRKVVKNLSVYFLSEMLRSLSTERSGFAPLNLASVFCPSRTGGGDPRPPPLHLRRPLGSLSIPRPDNTNAGKAQLAEYTNDRKVWKIETKKIGEDIKSAFAMLYAQQSESSGCEVQDHADWIESFNRRDLLYLIGRIRSTHIARQSGNPAQDMERVRTAWANMRMQSYETSFAFRKRVEDYQLERTSVGLEEIPADELIIGILNRLDMSRYHALVKDYLDNERRGIADLPELPSILWKEIKDTQVVRFRGKMTYYEALTKDSLGVNK
jgi:hypothetical protein